MKLKELTLDQLRGYYEAALRCDDLIAQQDISEQIDRIESQRYTVTEFGTNYVSRRAYA